MKTGGKLAIRRSDRPGDFIGIFTVQDKHTGGRRSREGARGPHMDRWRAQGVGRAPCPCGPSGTALAASFSQKFLFILKLTDIIFMEFSESVYLPYHVPIPFSGFWSLPESFFYVFFRCNYLNNV